MKDTCKYMRLRKSAIIVDILKNIDRLNNQLIFSRLINKSAECIPHVLSKKRKVSKRAVRFSDIALPFYTGLCVITGIGSLLMAFESCCTWIGCKTLKSREKRSAYHRSDVLDNLERLENDSKY
jgi:hypothetical protein